MLRRFYFPWNKQQWCGFIFLCIGIVLEIIDFIYFAHRLIYSFLTAPLISGLSSFISLVVIAIAGFKSLHKRLRESKPPSSENVSPRNQPIFKENTPLESPHEFYGRKIEREKLLLRTRIGAPTAFYGPGKIGKTWLIRYLELVAMAELGTNFHMIYTSPTLSCCSTPGDFIKSILESLGRSDLTSDPHNIGLQTLQDVVSALQKKNEIPVLCIDSIEHFDAVNGFDLNFFNDLFAITNIGLVMVVTSKKSKKSLDKDMQFNGNSLFKEFAFFKLENFNDTDARAFIQSKGKQAGFTSKEQAFLLDCTKKEKNKRNLGECWPPLRLQVAGGLRLDHKALIDKDNARLYNVAEESYKHRFLDEFEKRYRKVAAG